MPGLPKVRAVCVATLRTRGYAPCAALEQGEYQSKICPYGYRKGASGRLEPDPEAAVVVQQIFSLADGGMSATRIAIELSHRGIPTPGEYKAAHGNHTHDISRTHGIWTNSTVLRILDDERYIGTYVIGKRAVLEVGGTRSRKKEREKWFIIPDHHEPLIEKALFERIQANATRFSIPNKKTHTYPLRGKVICGCCGHALTRINRKTPYYICRHSAADERFSCHGLKILADDLEQTVFSTLKHQVEVCIETDLDALPVEALIPGRAEYDQQIEQLLDDKLRLYEQYLRGEIGLDDYKTQTSAYDERLLKTKNARSAWMVQAEQTKQADDRRRNREQAIQDITKANKLTNGLSELMIEKVYVFAGNRVEIAYKMQDIFS